MVSFENFVKSMPPSLSELKVTPSSCFPFKIPDDLTATNTYVHCTCHFSNLIFIFGSYRIAKKVLLKSSMFQMYFENFEIKITSLNTKTLATARSYCDVKVLLFWILFYHFYIQTFSKKNKILCMTITKFMYMICILVRSRVKSEILLTSNNLDPNKHVACLEYKDQSPFR